MEKCRKCRVDLPTRAKFCPTCGAKQDAQQNTKNRGNGQGSVYQLPNKKWIAIKTLGYTVDEAGKMHRQTCSKSGFRTKKEALEALPTLTPAPKKRAETFAELYEKWLPTHRAGKSTIDCYKAAYKYFAPVQPMAFAEITIDDLQECVDDCPHGKRTRENMKALCGLLYKYAIPRHLSTLNLGQYLIVGGGDTAVRNALPDEAVTALEANARTVPGADYVLCQCYLGFRPSELLALDARDYNRKERAFTGGAKTDAGRDRVVTISPKIQPIIDRLTRDKIAGPVFCGKDSGQMSIATYRAMFYAALEGCGIENPVEEQNGVKRRRYTPHSCRHTFATLMKRVSGSDKDKLELMGHTSTEMLRHYQDVNFEDLRRVTDAI